MQQQSKKVWSFWQSCTTADHAWLALQRDFQDQLSRVHDNLGREYVRFHGIFDDDVGILNHQDPSIGYSFSNIDKMYDFILSINMKQVIELDFMPSILSLKSLKECDPPNNYKQLYYLIYNCTQHLVDRYGEYDVSSWYFASYNGPNCNDNWYHNTNDTILFNTFKEYYNRTARAIESISNQFKIDGPSMFKMDWYPGDADSDSISHDGFYNLFLNLSNVMSDISDDIKIGITAYGCTYESV